MNFQEPVATLLNKVHYIAPYLCT